jgi:predicted DNA-binding WGR domain protein
MSFDERNASWTGGTREFLQAHSRTSSPRCWGIRVEGNRVITYWGQRGGALQEATEAFQGVNLGKKNEMSPDAYALDRAKEMCRKKDWEGYREIDPTGERTSLVYLDAVVKAEIDFDNLPLSLCFYKPDNSMGAGITKKAEEKKVFYARKRNGLMFVIARGEGPAKLYSRRMLRSHDDEEGTGLTWDQRFPHIIEKANEVMPPNTILLGELVMDRDGVDDFKHVQSITKSLTQQSLDDQLRAGWASFYCWDVAFWKGEDLVKTWPVDARYALTHELDGGRVIQPVEYHLFNNPNEAVAYAKARQWEGFVVVDPEGVYGDKAYNFKGKPDRPGTVCAKLKPEFEDDFIAIWDPDTTVKFNIESQIAMRLKHRGERSTKERNDLGIKSVALYQFNSKNELIYISNVSSGLTDAMKAELARDPATCWPQVWRVIYTDRTYKSQGDETNALTFARFDSKRVDKRPEECINTEL